MKKIVLFNGPPRSGKDVSASTCAAFFNGRTHMFKEKLIEIALTVSGMDKVVWDSIYENPEDASINKDTPLIVLGGLSQRQFLIKISEEWVKPTFGVEYFGIKAAEKIEDSHETCHFFSDSGFMQEVFPLMRMFESKNIMLVRIFRPGKTFDGDSRDYLDPKLFNYSVDINNNGSEEEFKKEVIQQVRPFLTPF